MLTEFIAFVAGIMAGVLGLGWYISGESTGKGRAFVPEAHCDTCQFMLLSPNVEPCASCDDECSNWIPRREGAR